VTDYILLKSAQRYLQRMQLDDQVRIVKALDALVTYSTGLDIKPLKGRLEFRLRVGKYRILFVEDTYYGSISRPFSVVKVQQFSK
jgi:mRNA interferase RelE/StbE